MADCQPFDILTLTHEAIRRGLEELEQLSQGSDDESAARCLEKYVDVTRVIFLHSAQEDVALYPKVYKKRPQLTEAFTATHMHEAGQFNPLRRRLEAASRDASARPAASAAVQEWIGSHRRHLQDEEDRLAPLLPQLFSHLEGIEVVRGILSLNVEAYESNQLSWVFERLNPDQRSAYLGILNACSPPGKFGSFLARLAPLITPQDRARYKAEGVLG